MARRQFTQWLGRSIGVGALSALAALPVAGDPAPGASGPATVSVSSQISGAEPAGPQRVLLIVSSAATYAQVVAVQSAGPQILPSADKVVMVSPPVGGVESAGPQRVATAGR